MRLSFFVSIAALRDTLLKHLDFDTDLTYTEIQRTYAIPKICIEKRKPRSWCLFQVPWHGDSHWGGWDVSRYDVWVVLIGSTLPSFYYYLSISQHLTFILPWPVGRPLILTSLPGSEIKAAHHKLRCCTMGASRERLL